MSYSFYIDTGTAPDFWNVVNAIKVEGICFANIELPESGPFVEDAYYQLYIDNISTRFVELRFSGGTFQVRTMIASCHEDYAVATEIVRTVALQTSALIQPESHDAMALEKFDETFDDDWIKQSVESGATALRSILRDPSMKLPLTIDGPNRPLVIGPRVLAEIDDRDVETFVENLIEKLRTVHFFNRDRKYTNAAPFLTRDSDFSFSIWLSGTPTIFDKVDYLIMSPEQLCVPYESLPLLIEDRLFMMLDDQQYVVEQIHQEQWPTLLEHAKTFAVDLPLPSEVPPVKKWWQFWKSL